jgi:hypothetical protein
MSWTRHGILGKTISTLLVALLTAGPGSEIARAASEPIPAPSLGALLSVASDPAGAQVFVDGELRGQTPLQVDRVSPGDHRVKVVKDGYLDNSRLVKLGAGRTDVQVKLTPHAGSMAPRMQVEDRSGGGGGGGKKWALIGLGVAAAGVAAFLLLREKNKPPIAGSINVSPSGAGMAGATSFSFASSGASDPNNDPLTFEWNFGDGGSGSGQTTTHVYNSPGTFNVVLTVKDPKGLSATTSASANVGRNLNGTWSAPRGSCILNPPRISVSQSGGNFNGTFTYGPFGGTTGGSGSYTGTISSSSNFVCPCSVSFSGSLLGLSVSFTGDVDAGLNAMRGTFRESGPGFSCSSSGFSFTRL